MFIQFNVAEDKMLAILREQLKRQPVCITNEFVDLKLRPALVDHFQFETPEFSSEAGPVTINVPTPDPDWALAGHLKPYVLDAGSHVRLTETVEVSIATLAQLDVANADPVPPADLVNVKVKVLFELSVEMDTIKKVPVLCLSAVDAELPPLPLRPVDVATIKAALTSFRMCNTFSIGALAALGTGPLKLSNAGARYDRDGKLFAVRLQIWSDDLDEAGTIALWTTFHGSGVARALGADAVYPTADWSLFIDQELLVKPALKTIADGLATADRFALESGPDASWMTVPSATAGPPGAAIGVTFGGEIIDACTCLWGEIDLNVDVTATIGFAVREPNVLETSTAFSWTLNDLEVFCCGLTAAVFWPVVGAILLDKGEINWGKYLAGWPLGPIPIFAAMIFAASTTPGGLSAGAACTKVSDTEFVCKQPFALSGPLFGDLTVTAATGLPSGLLLSGTLGPILDTTAARLDLAVGPFSWTVSGACDGAHDIATTAELVLRNTGEAPLRVCAARVQEDPLGQFTPYVTMAATLVGGGSDLVAIPSLMPEYLAKPYPLRLLIKTNGGARLLTIAAPTDLAPAARATMISMFELGCAGLKDSFWDKEITPRWGTDPGRPGDEHLWQAVVGGLADGDRIVLLDAGGQVLSEARGVGSGPAHVSALVTSGLVDGEVTLRRVAAGGGAPAAIEAHRLKIDQTLLARRAALTLSAPCTHLAAGRYQGMAALFVTTASGTSVYDVTVSTLPTLVDELSQAGLIGAAGWQDRLLTWGEQGFDRVSQQRVLSVAFTNGCAYALTEHDLAVYDRQLVQVGALPYDGGRMLVAAGGTLAIADQDRVRVFALADPHVPVLVGSISTGAVASLHLRRLLDNRGVLFAGALGGGGATFELPPTQQTDAIAHDTLDPWFVGAARVGGTLARLDSARRTLTVYDVAGTASL